MNRVLQAYRMSHTGLKTTSDLPDCAQTYNIQFTEGGYHIYNPVLDKSFTIEARYPQHAFDTYMERLDDWLTELQIQRDQQWYNIAWQCGWLLPKALVERLKPFFAGSPAFLTQKVVDIINLDNDLDVSVTAKLIEAEAQLIHYETGPHYITRSDDSYSMWREQEHWRNMGSASKEHYTTKARNNVLESSTIPRFDMEVTLFKLDHPRKYDTMVCNLIDGGFLERKEQP